MLDSSSALFTTAGPPKWTASAGYDHTFRLSNGSSLNAALSGQYLSERYTGFEFVAAQKAASARTYDFDVSYVSPSGRLMLGAFVHNIDNEPVYTGGSVQGFAPPLVYATVGPPRTYGIRLRYDFEGR